MPDPAAPEPTSPATVSAPHFTENLFAVLSETFAQTSGIYLDRGADVFSTLDALSAEEASREVLGTTIAAHAFHTAFYVRAMERYFEGFEGKIDWQGSWTTRAVTPDEWKSLRAQLRDDYDRATHKLRAVTHWDEAALDFGMTIAIHSAYHLGAIRQLAKAVKGER
jgi:hypothetical protein